MLLVYGVHRMWMYAVYVVTGSTKENATSLAGAQPMQVHAQTMGESGEPFFVRDAIKGMSPRIVYDRSSVFDLIWPCLLLRQKTGLG